ncbi:flagellar biosynthetic protein FliR [Sphingobium sufflavum]|uniref:flagellar biosynthetic protein FliR n=1 Tax=Sphingobium sufflavum TaxID=1129547 RepID=UPI001F491CB4|nr:flagellar biosynthetic protein FliR [Sphingobium sufflavum]MCE7795635.1 flagellar biosynthetic protein FliR [Sphingobium sufflavum]
MIAPGFAGVESQLWLWLVAMIRPGAAFIAAPIFGAPAVPVQIRLILSLAVGMAALNSVTVTLPVAGVVSFAGIALVGGEVVCGLMLGFTLQIAYAAAYIGGETIAAAMGLGFANMMDPQSGASTPVVGQFLSILATFMMLSLDGHLLLVQFVVDSYRALPPGGGLMPNSAVHDLVWFGGSMFGAGLTIALPVAFSLIMVQVVMAMLARSAPSLNLFSVGLPATLSAGLILLSIAAPVMADAIGDAISSGLDMTQTLAGGR